MALEYCSACGNQVSSEAFACPKCGHPLQGAKQVPRKNLSRTVAGLLSIFFGGIGINYFYLGKPGNGIICLLFCWTLIPSLIGLVGGIYLLAMDDATLKEKYCM